jgi:hypothetical protein
LLLKYVEHKFWWANLWKRPLKNLNLLKKRNLITNND